MTRAASTACPKALITGRVWKHPRGVEGNRSTAPWEAALFPWDFRQGSRISEFSVVLPHGSWVQFSGSCLPYLSCPYSWLLFPSLPHLACKVDIQKKTFEHCNTLIRHIILGGRRVFWSTEPRTPLSSILGRVSLFWRRFFIQEANMVDTVLIFFLIYFSMNKLKI